MKRILVISDDRIMRMLYSDLLGEDGYDIITAGSLADLMETLEHVRPDLIVLDHSLRNQDTFDLVQHYLQTRHEMIPLLLSTSFPPQCERKTGANETYVLKTPHLERLRERVYSMLRPALPPMRPLAAVFPTPHPLDAGKRRLEYGIQLQNRTPQGKRVPSS